MKMRICLIFIVLCTAVSAGGQKDSSTALLSPEGKGSYSFSPVVELKATSVKDQGATGACWCFATASFIESELLRMGKGEYDLSEMFIVRKNYINKLEDNFVKQGKGNLGEGSQSHDFMKIFAKEGIVPEEFYHGINYESATHNHRELQSYINAIGEEAVERRDESPQYHKIINAVLDIYLGMVPDSFSYKGTTYTPGSFAGSLGINPSDYVEITSFTNFPFYTRGILNVPDNWAGELFYNVPLDELTGIMDYSLNNGYTLNWDGDISESGFNHSKGVAVTSETKITQEMRQKGFDNASTTDDHLMHITGIVKDQDGVKYYLTKNSWGTENNPYGGYLNISENYVRSKTIFIMVNKHALPSAIRAELGIE
jgi:aminopeptidase C